MLMLTLPFNLKALSHAQSSVVLTKKKKKKQKTYEAGRAVAVITIL